MKYELPELSYVYNALEPFIDEETMCLHHDKHHAAYVNNLNLILKKHPELQDKTAEDLVKDLVAVPEDIRLAVCNNAGGHINHSMFWKIMAPEAGGEPSGIMAKEIEKSFGNFANFKAKFNEVGAKHFGSGWVWLVRKKDDQLDIVSTANQDNPLSDGLWPIMGNDVWEHAYYIKYRNVRADYLTAWWNVVDWQQVQKRWQA